jgi:hypothetical protein
MKGRKMQWEGHIMLMREIRNVKNFVRKYEKKRTLERQRHISRKLK